LSNLGDKLVFDLLIAWHNGEVTHFVNETNLC